MTARHTYAWTILVLLQTLAQSGCGDDLGACDTNAAKQLVYSQAGLVATKGQALMHDSCGSAAFCHSEGAKGEARLGAPQRLDFDMLPLATGWPSVVTHSKAIWASVLDGSMPPEGEGQRAVSNGNWSFDPEGRAGAQRLPPLSTRAGKAVLRNWLACGAPVVGDTVVPSWTRAPVLSDAGALSDWSALFTQIIAPRCATAGCHNTQTKAGGLALAEECAAYTALLEKDACGKPRLVPSNADSSLLDKLESSKPACGGPMPPAGSLDAPELNAIRAWVEAGAPAESCP